MVKKWLVLLCVLALFLLPAIGRSLPAEEPIAQSRSLSLPADFAPPPAKLLALGTATHGNAQPFEAALQILRLLFEQEGDVALLLEDNVQTGIRLNVSHSFYDSETKKHFGFYTIYHNQEMQAVLDWCSGKQVRLYGIDIQSVSEIGTLLFEKLQPLGFPNANEIPWKTGIAAAKNTANDRLKTDCLRAIRAYLAQLAATGRIDEKEAAYFSFLLRQIEMNRAYKQGGSSSTMRDQMMAENAAWIVAYENKYYGNARSLLLASNGHVLKPDYGFSGTADSADSEIKPMGAFLAEALGSDYYAVVTEAQHNAFRAQSGQRAATKKTFFIERAGALYEQLSAQKQELAFLTTELLQKSGIRQWDLTTVGWYFTATRAKQPVYYTIPTTVGASYDAILLYKNFTPLHEL